MADAFRKLEYLPPLRLTIRDLAQIGDELARQISSGGRVDVEYTVSFEDGTNFKRDSSEDFLSNLDAEGDAIDQVTLSITAWGPADDGIAKTADLQLRRFGSQFQVASRKRTRAGRGYRDPRPDRVPRTETAAGRSTQPRRSLSDRVTVRRRCDRSSVCGQARAQYRRLRPLIFSLGVAVVI